MLKFKKISMQPKTTIIISIIIIIIIAAAGGFYLYKQGKFGGFVNDVKNKNNDSADNQKNNGVPQSKIITDDFSIDLPEGWTQAQPPMGTSAMAVNTAEVDNDPAVKKINFRSYFAVSYDQTQGKSLIEYAQKVKNELSQATAGVIFNNEQDIIINNKPARAFDAELTQQGINFKVLVVLILGNGEDIWAISFSATKANWAKYEKTFSEIANSFVLKQ